VACLALAGAFASGNAADFLIVESIAALSVLNQYQEPLTAAERGAFLPYAPLAVQEADATIGDGLTRAMKCTYLGRTYYVLRDEAGGFAGDRGGSYRLRLRGCTSLKDTVELIAPARLSRRHGEQATVALARGERLVRVLRYGDACYALRLGPKPQFGWCPWSTAWRKPSASAAQQDRALPPELRRRLRERVAGANAAYRAYFDHFNRLTGKGKSVPQWKAAGDTTALRWRMSAPYDRTDELAESTDALVQEMAGMVIGRPFAVEFRDGELAVRAAESR